MKEEIFNVIKEKSGKITFKQLSMRFDIDRVELKKILLELKLAGRILQVENKYVIFPNNLQIGSVSASTTGRKYIIKNRQKYFINNDYQGRVILNDKVAFKLNDKNEAEIVSVIDRTLGNMTCEVKVINGKKKVIPYHNGINFVLPKEVMDTLYDGDIIVVEVTPSEIPEYDDAKFVKKIGRRDDASIEDATIAINYGFDNEYNEEYMQEIREFPTEVSENETIGRYDYRDQQSVTIDGIYTKDMDDGVYGEKIGDIIRVYVHIADVSHYVKPGTKVFERACDKTTSLYMNNSVFHMFHYLISNGICSLNEGVDRLTKTVIMDIDKDGNIVDFNIVKSVINSKKKMTYEDVDEILMNDKIPDGYEEFIKQIYILADAAVRLENRYTNTNGKITFANTELNIIYNDDGTIRNIAKRDDSISRKIIENLMIAANETVAKWFSDMDFPTVYRVHEFPDIDKINAVISEINKSGYKIKKIKEVDDTKSLQKTLSILSNYEAYPIISQLLVMAMQRAIYSTTNIGHYALGLDAYLHFTSPIRRLPDLLVHMMVDVILVNYDKITPEYLAMLEGKLQELAKRSTTMSINADIAEAEAERRLLLDKLSKHIGEEYEASIIEFGKRIKIRVEGIDTFVDLHEIDSALAFDGKRHMYYDKDNGTYLKIGTKVLVRLTNVTKSNNSFNVMLLGIIPEAKKKVLNK